MRHIAFLFVCLFSTLAITHPVWAEPPAAPTPTEVVEKLHNGLMAAMKDGPKLGFQGRRALLEPVVKSCFDIPTMSRVSTGGAWAKLSEGDRARVIDAFTKYTVANYASQFKEPGVHFETKSDTDGGRGRRKVTTNLLSPGDDPVELDYVLRQDDTGQWKIVDVDLDGSVSQLALHVSEFGASLAAGGVDNLIAQMEKTTANLAKGG